MKKLSQKHKPKIYELVLAPNFRCTTYYWSTVFDKCAIPHYGDVIMSAMACQTTGVSIIYSTVSSGVDQRKHQSSPSLAFVRGIHWWPVNSPQKGPVTQKMFPFDDVILKTHLLVLWRDYWEGFVVSNTHPGTWQSKEPLYKQPWHWTWWRH